MGLLLHAGLVLASLGVFGFWSFGLCATRLQHVRDLVLAILSTTDETCPSFDRVAPTDDIVPTATAIASLSRRYREEDYAHICAAYIAKSFPALFMTVV